MNQHWSLGNFWLPSFCDTIAPVWLAMTRTGIEVYLRKSRVLWKLSQLGDIWAEFWRWELPIMLSIGRVGAESKTPPMEPRAGWGNKGISLVASNLVWLEREWEARNSWKGYWRTKEWCDLERIYKLCCRVVNVMGRHWKILIDQINLFVMRSSFR